MVSNMGTIPNLPHTPNPCQGYTNVPYVARDSDDRGRMDASGLRSSSEFVFRANERILIGKVVIASSLTAEEIAFVAKPTVSMAGEKVRIAFTVNRWTDVTVTIEDAAGRIVRHLVSGTLGRNPPAPLKADSLAQEVAWDFCDDDGRPVSGGPFRVRVQLGLTPQFDSFLLDNRDRLGIGEKFLYCIGATEVATP